MRLSSPSSATSRPSTAWTATYLKGRVGDRINAVLAAAGYNFGLLLRWLAELCVPSSGPSPKLSRLKRSLNQRSSAFFTED